MKEKVLKGDYPPRWRVKNLLTDWNKNFSAQLTQRFY